MRTVLAIACACLLGCAAAESGPAVTWTIECDLGCPDGLTTTWRGSTAESSLVEQADLEAEYADNCRGDLAAAGCAAPRCACRARRQ